MFFPYIINRSQIKEITGLLRIRHSVVFQYQTVENQTVLDVLLTLNPMQLTTLNRINYGDTSNNILYVSIIGIGCFAFELYEGKIFYASYLAEKLNLGQPDAEAITDMLNIIVENCYEVDDKQEQRTDQIRNS